ncbi:HAMP domain-containing protein [Cohnella algarum]|uniref:HAMP domain-containing protein n=1 Tax=Cohnella algarum TaxID=2044859 RepID=UPI001F07DF63|nr:hypothetical protein [Cohnella algarum]
MKKLRVRSFMILAPVLISASAWVTYVIVRFAATGTLVFGSEDRAPDPDLIWFSSLFGFALAVFLIGYAMRKWIARPLEAMGEAARRIAGGISTSNCPNPASGKSPRRAKGSKRWWRGCGNPSSAGPNWRRKGASSSAPSRTICARLCSP